MVDVTRVFEAQIRDTTAHESSNATNETGITVVEDGLHSGNNDIVERFDSFAVYVINTHDQGFDATIETDEAGGDFANAAPEDTTTYASGNAAVHRFDGPAGRIQIRTATGALSTAPASGSLRVIVMANEDG